MKFIANGLNGVYLRDILGNIDLNQVSEVKAAIAYAADDPPALFEWCWKNQIKLSFWCRYDYRVPVATAILKKFLDRKSFKYNCYLATDYFHSKVIWFVDQGVYIGSANLTDRAWNTNIEAGIFLSQDDIVRENMESEFNNFFDGVNAVSTELNQQAYDYLVAQEKKWNKDYSKSEDENSAFKENSPIKIYDKPSTVTKKNADEKKKEKFLEKWHQVTGILEKIVGEVGREENFPIWVPKGTPRGIVLDQFLHDYYYRVVKDPEKANSFRVEEFYEDNKNSIGPNLLRAITAWKDLNEASSGEDDFIQIRSPLIFKNLSQVKLKSLTMEDFVQVCRSFHSFWEVARYADGLELGLQTARGNSTADKLPLLAKKVYSSKAPNGMDIRDILYYVLYGGSFDQIVNRAWQAIADEDYKINHFGSSCYCELIGLANPDKMFPVNGRTLKALRSLGHNINLHL